MSPQKKKIIFREATLLLKVCPISKLERNLFKVLTHTYTKR